jgi:amino acid permease
MNIVVRIFITLFTFLASYFFIYWVPFSLISAGTVNPVIQLIVSVILASGIAYFIWKNTKSLKKKTTYMLTAAVIIGSVGFLLGFFLPMLLDPEANQGPMLGFVMGPFGFLIGFFGAGISWNLKLLKAKSQEKIE